MCIAVPIVRLQFVSFIKTAQILSLIFTTLSYSPKLANAPFHA